MNLSEEQKRLLKQLGLNIRKLREIKALSQEKLAEKCNLHRTYISDVERGKRNISVINILKIANALNVKPKELFVKIME